MNRPARPLPALVALALVALLPEARAQFTHSARSNLFTLDLREPALALALPALQQPLAGGSVTVDATPSGATGELAYQWYFNGRAIPSAMGGTAATFTIPGHAVNNGAWRVVVSSSTQSAEATFDVSVPGAAEPVFALSIGGIDPETGDMTFTFPAAFGRGYSIEESADLVTWTTVESDIPGNGAAIVRQRAVADRPRTFIRAVRSP